MTDPLFSNLRTEQVNHCWIPCRVRAPRSRSGPVTTVRRSGGRTETTVAVSRDQQDQQVVTILLACNVPADTA